MFVIAWMISLAVSCYSIRLPPGVDSIYSLSQERLLRTAPKITELDNLQFPPAIRLLIHDVRSEPWIDYMNNQIQYLAEVYLADVAEFLLIRGAPTSRSSPQTFNLSSNEHPFKDDVALFERALRHLGSVANFLFSDSIWPLWRDAWNAEEALKLTDLLKKNSRNDRVNGQMREKILY